MKGPRELKNYVARHREYIKRGRWDDMLIFKLQETCKKWYKRNKNIKKEEFDD